MTPAALPDPSVAVARPPLPRTPALRHGPMAVRTSWAWSTEHGAPVGTVGFLGVRIDGGTWKIDARVLTVAVLRLPGPGALGHGLSLQRGPRRRLGGGTVSVTSRLRRVGRDDPALRGLLLLADRDLAEDRVRGLVGPTVLAALRPRDLGFDWQGRELVVHAAGVLDPAGRAELGRAAAVLAEALGAAPGAAATTLAD